MFVYFFIKTKCSETKKSQTFYNLGWREYILLDKGYKIWLHLSKDRIRPIITTSSKKAKFAITTYNHTHDYWGKKFFFLNETNMSLREPSVGTEKI